MRRLRGQRDAANRCHPRPVRYSSLRSDEADRPLHQHWTRSERCGGRPAGRAHLTQHRRRVPRCLQYRAAARGLAAVGRPRVGRVCAHERGCCWLERHSGQAVRRQRRTLAGRQAAAQRGGQVPWIREGRIMTDLSMMSADALVAGYSRGEFSPLDATRAALDAIAAHEQAVNAFVLVDEEVALSMAEASATRYRAGAPVGPADGVPVSIKDMFLTAGWPTMRGSNLIDAHAEWREDAPATARLREAGTVFLGKTTTPEFAWKGVTDSICQGITCNPWGAGLTAGGSSGGSATAVGLGMGTWSVGTDGGGSVRIPASFTGTVAFKPTYGVVPMYPSSPYGTLAHAGPMTRTVTDAAMMLDVLAGFDARDWSALQTPTTSFVSGLRDGVEGLRLAFSADLGIGSNEPQVDAAVRAAVQVFVEAGAKVDDVHRGLCGRATVTRWLAQRPVDFVDPLHIPVQYDPAAGPVVAVRLHHRPAADRAAGGRAAPRRCRGVAHRGRLRGADLLAPSRSDAAARERLTTQDANPRRTPSGPLHHHHPGQARRELQGSSARRRRAPHLPSALGSAAAKRPRFPWQVRPERDLCAVTRLHRARSGQGEHHSHAHSWRRVLVHIPRRRSGQPGLRLRGRE